MSHITVVIGTARDGRMSEHVAHAITQMLEERSHSYQLADVKDHVHAAVTVPPWGPRGADTDPTSWKEIVAKTDTFIFVLPEYNHSYPGEWKILMDSLYKEYAGKRAYVAAVGGGIFSGARVMEHVIPVLSNFVFILGRARLHIGNVSNAFSETGELSDADTKARIEKFVDAVIKEA